jgi:hypothetical protein
MIGYTARSDFLGVALMRRTSFVFIAIATLIFTSAFGCFSVGRDFSQAGKSTAVSNESWTVRMGWRYVSYTEGNVSLFLSIEPMVKGNDRVYVPGESSWLKATPSWKSEQRSKILSRLKSYPWNRRLTWQECDCPLSLGPHQVIRGSLESTPGGQALEDQRLFEPGSNVTHEQAHEKWQQAARMFAEKARGNVTIFMSEIIPDSVFQAVELPALKKNPNVTLIFK